MSDINYSKDVYDMVVSQKKENEEYITELYSYYDTLSLDDMVSVSRIINELKTLNNEYEKYIIIYERQNFSTKTQNTYTIAEGDTLPRIAQKVFDDYSRWQELYNYNNLKDLKLSPGDTLLIPEDS